MFVWIDLLAYGANLFILKNIPNEIMSSLCLEHWLIKPKKYFEKQLNT